MKEMANQLVQPLPRGVTPSAAQERCQLISDVSGRRKMKTCLPLLVLVLGLTGYATNPKENRESTPPATAMKDVINLSRRATTEISSVTGSSKGTGFIIGRKHVVTCFHVVARIAQDGRHFTDIFQDLKVKLSTGDEISATVVSIPSQQSPEPLYRDFAVLELQHEIPQELASSVLEVVTPAFEVGDDVFFSGYPLATPAMVTHKGMISGYDAKSSVICVQGAINKGNSGGALCDASGHVIGIISMREGGIGLGLNELNTYIEEAGKNGSVRLQGVDPLQAIREISQTLDLYISTGIGYAHSSASLKAYLDGRPDLKK